MTWQNDMLGLWPTYNAIKFACNHPLRLRNAIISCSDFLFYGDIHIHGRTYTQSGLYTSLRGKVKMLIFVPKMIYVELKSLSTKYINHDQTFDSSVPNLYMNDEPKMGNIFKNRKVDRSFQSWITQSCVEICKYYYEENIQFLCRVFPLKQQPRQIWNIDLDLKLL